MTNNKISANPRKQGRLRRVLSVFLLLAGLNAQAADLVIDNGDPGFSTIGTWPTSTAVAAPTATYGLGAATGPTGWGSLWPGPGAVRPGPGN